MAKVEEKKKDTEEAKGTELSKAEQAENAVTTYLLWSMAAGMAPVVVDTIAVSGVQLKMLHSLSKIYDIPFKKDAGKSVTASLMGGLGTASVSRGGVGTAIKLIPFIGPMVGTIAMPVIAGATTYAIGKLFSQHFASGGTFLDFDASTMKEPFEKLYEEGKKVATKVATSMKPKKKAKKAKKEAAKETAA